MSAVMHSHEALAGPRGPALSSPAWTRGLLIGACLAAVALTAWAVPAGTLRETDPELARLLRGMALIKATLVLAVMGVLWWRAGLPLALRTAAVYGLGAAAMAGATVSIWQLDHIGLAAAAFHVGALAVMVMAWRDGRDSPSFSA